MSLLELVFREIRHRRWNFLLGLLSVTVAVACLVASLTVLNAHEIQTRRVLAKKQEEHRAALAAKQQEVRDRVAGREKELAASLAKIRKDVKQKVAGREQELAAALANTRTDVEKRIAGREADVKAAGAALQDTMRKITKNLGFNLYILPQDQDLGEYQTTGMLTKTMPESFVKTLSNSKVMTINHILPMITHRIDGWQGPQKKQTILVAGTRGEVPFSHRTAKKPLKDGEGVPEGTIILGYNVHTQQQLKKGDTVKLLGLDLKVSKLHPQRGTIDDSTVWINLKQAQKALGKQNLVNVILALECNCAALDRIGDIRKDIARVLPGTKVIELDRRKALARAEARNKAKKQAEEALKAAKADGRKQLDQLAADNKALLAAEKRKGAEDIAAEKQRGAAALATAKQHGADDIAAEKRRASEDLRREEQNRTALGKQRESFASILVPLVIGGCAVWIGFLAFGNVRQRAGEIGILRAIGLKSGEILTIFLTKALLVGVIGAVAGYLLGFGLGVAWGDLPMTAASGEQLFDIGNLLLAILMAPLLAGLASWIPAMLAARQDPAVVLQGE